MTGQTTESPEFKDALQKIERVIEGKPREMQRRILEGAIDIEDITKWLASKSSLSLEKNDCSRLHKLKEAMSEGRVINSDGNTDYDAVKVPLIECMEHTFVVKHDWAGVLSDAEGISDDFQLPYDTCAFEFRIGGHTVLAAFSGAINGLSIFVDTGNFWYIPSNDIDIATFVWSQVRAICIVLDAEIATHSVIRAPNKLNEKRERAGKTPLADYHVIDLARRHRVANPSGGSGTGTRKRLHFRRGHWRHYETSKTWVKWCLVGNPDLGFIQKSYTL